jgi:FtsX-like permease family protein
MRWLLAPVAGCVLLLAACGGGTRGPAPTAASPAALVVAGLEPPSGCYVTVFLAEDVTKAQIRSVRQRLLASRAVTEVSFVSKELELRRFRLTNPKAAKGMHLNPFADRFEVVPRTHGGVFAIVGDFATRGGPITNVKPSRSCAGGG